MKLIQSFALTRLNISISYYFETNTTFGFNINGNNRSLAHYFNYNYGKKHYFSTYNYKEWLARTIDGATSKEITTILNKSFNCDVKIKSTTQLSAPERPNTVHRINLENTSSAMPKSLILKQFLPQKPYEHDREVLDRFTRDWAGLKFLSKFESINPRKFYGGSYQERFLLMEDLGENYISLVDSLTVREESTATASAALKRFMQRLGQLHAECYGKTYLYTEELKKLNPNINLRQDDLKVIFGHMSPVLKKLGLSYTLDLQKETEGVVRSTLMPGDFSSFVHGDICPDNVFDDRQTNEIRIIDFEWSYVGNALLDGTYLRMGMPTCWCAKTIPKDLIKSLEVIYREELKQNIPAANNDHLYYNAYTNACAYWMLQSILYIEDILDSDSVARSGFLPENSEWKPEANLLRPRTLTALLAFSEVARQHGHLPYLRAMAEDLLKLLKILWPNTTAMDLYPAFMSTIESESDIIGDISDI